VRVRVTLVHDWLTGMRGGERILHELALMFPGAPLHTLIHVPGSTSPAIEALRIQPSPLSTLPGVARHYRKLLPLFPRAIEALALEPCDVVLSTSHAFAKGVRAPAGARHLCYCMTPMRYVWDQIDAYLGRGAQRWLAAPLVGYLRRWDVRTSTPERVARFVAISHTVADRIRRHYGRPAPVVYPPVDVLRFEGRERDPGDAYLLIGGFVPYKNEALALAAFAELGRPLIVAGDGPTRRRLEAQAPSNVRFVGRVSDAELARLLSEARALVYPQLEDFGIIAVEAQAAGCPVIALGQGGACETVVPLGAPGVRQPTGVWFEEARPESLAQAVQRFEDAASAFDPKVLRAHARRFDTARFRQEIGQQIELLRAD
jgi:glycosyltransferase involved in cell wall biosynthesis